MVDALARDPVLLAFVAIAAGAAVGAVRIRGVALGPAAALFVGLALGALDERLSDADGLGLLRELGLVLFTYTIGLASGPTFLNGLRRGGLIAVGATVVLVAGLAGLCAAVGEVLDLGPADRAGLFAGATTNTPALQAAAEAVDAGTPVVAYSLTYPAAVVAMLVVTSLLLGRHLPTPPALQPREREPEDGALVTWTVEVTTEELPPLGDLRRAHPGIAFSRVEHDHRVSVPDEDRPLEPGEAVVVVGPERIVAGFAAAVGRRSERNLPLDRSQLDFRRIVVSNRQLAGRRLGDLDLAHRLGVVVTRVRRGDDDHVADDDFELELGDRARVVGPAEGLAAAARLLGDSERRLAEVDAIGFALGATAGIALGTATVHVGSVDLELGAGGGPLAVGLVLGIVSRTGPITWQIPHGANQVLRQLGILMFLACAGVASGTAFADAVVTRAGLELLVAGAVVASLFAALVPLVLAAAVRREPVETAGMLAGVETQPAALTYATDRTGGDERVARAYALVFPVAMLAKVVVVQLLV